MTHKNWKIASR